MRARVGLGIGRDAVRVVVVAGGAVRWAAEAPVEAGQALQRTIAGLLARAPLRRWPKPALSAAVGPHASQVKLVAGLPEVTDQSTLSAVIRANVGTFFLKNGVPLMITNVRPVDPGAAWAAALDRPTVESVREACRAIGWRLGVIAPSGVALPLALEGTPITWTDGRLTLEISWTDHVLTSLRTRPARAGDRAVAPPLTVRGLAGMGDHAFRFADAYAAAVLDPAEPLALDAEGAGWWTGDEIKRHLIAPGAALLLAVVSLALSPLGARWTERRAQGVIDRVRPDQWATIDSAYAQLRRATTVLTEVNRFASFRTDASRLLGDLARALPDSCVVTSFELDGGSAQALVLTRRPAAVLGAARDLPGLVAANLVTDARDRTDGVPGLERVLLRFQLPPARDAVGQGSPKREAP